MLNLLWEIRCRKPSLNLPSPDAAVPQRVLKLLGFSRGWNLCGLYWFIKPGDTWFCGHGHTGHSCMDRSHPGVKLKSSANLKPGTDQQQSLSLLSLCPAGITAGWVSGGQGCPLPDSLQVFLPGWPGRGCAIHYPSFPNSHRCCIPSFQGLDACLQAIKQKNENADVSKKWLGQSGVCIQNAQNSHIWKI